MDTADPIEFTSSTSEDRSVKWEAPYRPEPFFPPSPRILYLVEDRSRIFKAYKDRFFIFTAPETAIQKARELGLGEEKIITPEMLVPETVFHFEQGGFDTRHIEVFVLAISLTGELR